MVSALHPVPQTMAHPNSLSATYGLGAQPLHTDGAHLPAPPDILVFISRASSGTPTLLWRPNALHDFGLSQPKSARHGMFLVQNGRDSFFSSALDGMRYRFDPGCMSPCDLRAEETMSYFSNALHQATAYDWSFDSQLLVVDNRRALHARSSVADGDGQRTLLRIAFRIGQTQ
jgi:hypothetical protein